ncbi:MAG: FAD-dependent oxidoreductase [Pseudomonadota bacterium]
MLDALIVGAGLTGLVAAHALEREGWRVRVVEKARGPGGRMSTRRDGDLRFDHGAQYFTARDGQFRQAVEGWLRSGIVAPWSPRLAVIDALGIAEKEHSPARFVGVPGMSAVCASLAGDLRECQYRWQAQAITATDGGWSVTATHGETINAARVLLTCPAQQVAALTPACAGSTQRVLAEVQMRPCWAVLATFDRPLLEGYDAAFVNVGPLSWVASQRQRPGRPAQDAWVLHATADWSEANLELSPVVAAKALVDAARALAGLSDGLRVLGANAHRWRYAIARSPLDDQLVCLAGESLLAGGDWAFGSRVEGAWRSGCAAAARWLRGSS